jgi:molecular chaperone DnaK
LQVTIGVPANANSNQRFLTAEAFRSAGFQVLGMLNEPSAASIEYGHRRRAERKGQPRHTLLVYDLGGGTFDASLVDLVEDTHTVVAAAGLSDVGGDDFDEILAGLALAAAPGLPRNGSRSLGPSSSGCWRSAANGRSRSTPIRER